MSLQNIQNKIEEFISNTRNDSLVIKGNWGVGKTYFWQNLIQRALEADSKITNRVDLGLKHYAYVSLFGVSNADELKDSILTATIFARDSKGKYSRLNQFANQLAVAGKKSEYLNNITGNLLTTLAFNDIYQTLICFDDIERRTKSLELDYVLGLANYLKEQRNCKIVIILNENSMEDNTVFRKHIEKVADYELLFSLQPEEAIRLIFSNTFSYFEIIKTYCLKLNIKNLRILKRIKTYIEQLLPLITASEIAVIEEIIASVILFIWSYYDKDSKVPNLEFIKKFSPSGLYLAKKYENKEINKEEEEWNQLLGAYRFFHTEEMDNVLISFVEEGYLQVEKFKKLLDDKNKISLANLGGESYREAWDIYNSSFDCNEKDFAEILVKKFKENSIYLSLENLQTTAETLRDFEYGEQADELIDHYLLNDIPEQDIIRFVRNAFDDNRDETLIAKLEGYQSKNIRNRSLSEITGSLQYRNGWQNEDLVELDKYSEEEFFEFFKEYKGDDLYYRVKACLQFKKFAHGEEIYKSVSEKAENALKKIARECKINKMRISNWFGIITD